MTTTASVHDRLAGAVEHRPAGWGTPSAARHAHLFDAGAMLSACGRVLYFGDTTAAPGRVKRCPTCYRIELEGEGVEP